MLTWTTDGDLVIGKLPEWSVLTRMLVLALLILCAVAFIHGNLVMWSWIMRGCLGGVFYDSVVHGSGVA